MSARQGRNAATTLAAYGRGHDGSISGPYPGLVRGYLLLRHPGQSSRCHGRCDAVGLAAGPQRRGCRSRPGAGKAPGFRGGTGRNVWLNTLLRA